MQASCASSANFAPEDKLRLPTCICRERVRFTLGSPFTDSRLPELSSPPYRAFLNVKQIPRFAWNNPGTTFSAPC